MRSTFKQFLMGRLPGLAGPFFHQWAPGSRIVRGVGAHLSVDKLSPTPSHATMTSATTMEIGFMREVTAQSVVGVVFAVDDGGFFQVASAAQVSLRIIEFTVGTPVTSGQKVDWAYQGATDSIIFTISGADIGPTAYSVSNPL